MRDWEFSTQGCWVRVRESQSKLPRCSNGCNDPRSNWSEITQTLVLDRFLIAWHARDL